MNTNANTKAIGYGARPSGYRLPADTRLGRVVLQVAQLDRSVGFYQQVLGLRLLSRADGRASLGPHDEDRVLVELRERQGAEPVPRGGRTGLYHFAILLPHREALGRFVAHLSRIGVRPGASDHLVSEAIYLNDPDGLGIEVYSDRPRSEWRHEGGELKMATAPLDLPDLLDAGGGGVWTGAPAGTTIGHIHLHVGEMEAAERFYHEGLGFDRVVWSYPGALFLSVGGYHHHLGVNRWAADPTPAAEGDARLLEWVLVLPSLDALEEVAASLASGGISVEHDGAELVVADPWGIALRIVSAAS